MRGRSFVGYLLGSLGALLAVTCRPHREGGARSDALVADGAATREPSVDGESPGAAHESSASTRASCPDDMVYVETSFCENMERRCVDLEKEHANHLSICHAFSHGQRCDGKEKDIAFCIDRYEYPNRQGAHPAWMIDWSDAQATCEAHDKRLCWASEWTAACEGPEHSPFPYGWERDHDRCNMDNLYVEPRRPGRRAQFLFYSKDPQVSVSELFRLDQSVPSGSMESCKSGFGVYDMTGNFDEWVTSDEPPRDRSKWAGLKGGGWGHVRNQCRAMTTSHEPEFTYYFVGFRCCRDAPDRLEWTPSPRAERAPAVSPSDLAVDVLASAASAGVEASATSPAPRMKYSRTGKRQ